MTTRELTGELQDAGVVLKPGDVVLGEICVVKATNRQALITAINQYVDSFFFDGTENRHYLYIELSGEQLGCEGCSARYATEADIPYHSVPCSCGNPKHWLIKYEEGG